MGTQHLEGSISRRPCHNCYHLSLAGATGRIDPQEFTGAPDLDAYQNHPVIDHHSNIGNSRGIEAPPKRTARPLCRRTSTTAYLLFQDPQVLFYRVLPWPQLQKV